MNKILVVLLTAISLSAQAQIPELKISPNIINGNINGGTIKKGDTVQVSLMYKSATGYPVRSFYLDFQHQITAINMIDIKFPTAGAQGSAIPAGATTSFQNQYYPGYYFNRNANNTTESGLSNSQYAGYLYTQGGDRAINRIWVVSSGNLVDGKLCDIRFRVEQVQAGFAYDSIYYNFANAYSGEYGGTSYDVKMPKPNSAWVDVLATSNALIKGELKLNGLIDGYRPQVIIVDSATGIVKANILPSPSGIFTLSSELAPNTAYKAYVAIKSDSIPSILSKSITVSDYTAAATEFIKQNLNGTFSNSNIASGIGFLAADINNNRSFDGGDVTALFAQAVGADTIFNAQTGQSIWNVPAFLSTTYDTLTVTGWKSLTDIYTVNFKTGDTARPLNISYLIPGDINRSHSSTRTQAQNITTYSLQNMIVNANTGAISYVNTGNDNISAIDINLNNLTVTSNNIEIPFSVDTKNNNVSALQFEVVYDPTKVKFEEIKSEVPNTWFVFVNPKDGVLRFGAIDKELKTPINGISAPFKLKFSSIGAGVDLNTRIKITQNLDASDNKGNQLGINLNTTQIKLTGYNNF